MAELKTKEGLVVGLIKQPTSTSKPQEKSEQETADKKSSRRK